MCRIVGGRIIVGRSSIVGRSIVGRHIVGRVVVGRIVVGRIVVDRVVYFVMHRANESTRFGFLEKDRGSTLHNFRICWSLFMSVRGQLV